MLAYLFYGAKCIKLMTVLRRFRWAYKEFVGKHTDWNSSNLIVSYLFRNCIFPRLRIYLNLVILNFIYRSQTAAKTERGRVNRTTAGSQKSQS